MDDRLGVGLELFFNNFTIFIVSIFMINCEKASGHGHEFFLYGNVDLIRILIC